MYFTKHSDEEVQTKAIIGLGKLNLSFLVVFSSLSGRIGFLTIMSLSCWFI